MLRLDLLDPLISGNKWFKLKYHLQAATARGAQGLISLGGAHSNHLHALAAAGKRFGFATVGLLRGEPQQTRTTDDLQACGMQLHWLSYAQYRARHQAGFWLGWLARYPGFYPVPEGGGGLAGMQGCADLLTLVKSQLGKLGWADYHGWWLGVGTGMTLAGLVRAESGAHCVYGALAVPQRYGVAEAVQGLLLEAGVTAQDYRLCAAARGGFARVDAALLEFMQSSEAQSGVMLEPVYTAKALMALREHVQAGYFAAGTRLVFLHTGGLQGREAALQSFRSRQGSYTAG